MTWWEVLILGIIEGITEFLPVSSTGMLTISESLMGLDIIASDVTAFTAIIQIGAIFSAVIYFWSDIWRILKAWILGIVNSKKRNTDYFYGWNIIIASIPIVIFGLVFKDTIETTLRNLWFVVVGLLVWSFVMWYFDVKISKTKKPKNEKSLTWQNSISIGFWQIISLIPGVSRSGAVMSAGLAHGFDRLTSTKLSFFMGMPALVGAGVLQIISHAGEFGVGDVSNFDVILGTLVSFLVGYFAIDWLIKFVSSHSLMFFVYMRIGIAVILASLLIFDVLRPF